ncbi:MAG: preprotein translocase subunit SecA [Candidatus Zambryskibacteria bacterium RIFOXYD1_FULL_40_13]|nr:MAG: Protein translocase subunit SecA [Parcubacteria group bacterium GW2011_GWC1_39_12]KKR19047.1 MAG: Protein translocase subunit SecA [Parcubacteria group bacterium GW2011_GWF1_39_37]KKR35614.1 MAG: Protein translocase subunit SecA [Parcubacteria group bacterium GW2011_GWC2_40_10]KKR52025.1 MAG: Protein translocase subunit SecA [Parcubacteria group bacterium GW2011_GWE1_40_20]KKR68783.1 MAG: Protein translocase subunit SecA [Parcubacteria group bacterium GW2011_GWF2_40_69]KKR81940.1 MAG: 
MAFLDKIFGSESSKALKEIQPIVSKINALESGISALSDDELKAKTADFRKRLDSGETLDEILPEAFAVVREASKRTLGQRHFDVQMIGGIVLHRGGIAEMKTGEGKTLVATLPLYLNALSGKGVHLVTVNDYLSRLHAVLMGQIYSFLGISVGIINHDESFIYDQTHTELDKKRDETGSFKVFNEFLRPVTRREAYHADITYGTNNEFGFDYLRDNIEYESGQLRQREPNFVVVDEVDSILIDEARTPLIISAPTTDSDELYKTFADISTKMEKGEHYTVDEKFKTISLTDSGISKAESLLGVENIYTEKGIKYVHHLETAIRATALFNKDKDYVVKEGEIIIVDEFTGRLQPGRRWSEGLHQAIEAKEHVPIQKESRTFASVTFQNYFRLYKKLAGMTGTAMTSSEEFYKVYGLNVVSIPTNRPNARIDRNDLIFQTEVGKFKAISREIKERHSKGQPVLVGTVSIEKNELLSEYLKVDGVPHEILNAKNHGREGEIIAQAGRPSAVTIATNMAGRGVDIKLGGNPGSQEAYEEVKSKGGLFVLGTERHDARRIDNQLRGRSGRQGDPGETQFFVSLDDHLMRVFGGDGIKNMMGKLGIKEDEPIENRMITRSLEGAQEKIEGFNFDARKHVLEFDDVLNFQRKIVYARRRDILLGDDEAVKAYIQEILVDANEAERKSVEEKISKADSDYLRVLRRVILQSMDMYWVEHLEVMDYMRSSVNLRAYGQRDPLVEYKREGLQLFKSMEISIGQEVIKLIPQIQPSIKFDAPVKLTETMEDAGGLTAEAPKPSESHRAPDGSRVGRNDPCWCGAKKSDGVPIKYKNCHGK